MFTLPNFYRQLLEITARQRSVERKCACVEAKLTRVRSERDELRTRSERLVQEQRALLAHTKTPADVGHLQRELSEAREHISRLEQRAQLRQAPGQPEVSKLQRELSEAREHISQLHCGNQRVQSEYHAKMK